MMTDETRQCPEGRTASPVFARSAATNPPVPPLKIRGARGVMNEYTYNDPTTKLNRRRLRKAATDAERKLWSILRSRQMAGLKFFRQYGAGPYILDFYCPHRRLAVEVDGGQHGDVGARQHDDARGIYLNELGIRVIRFWNNDVLQNIEGVAERITEEVQGSS